MQCLIYGANGYSGELIAREAVRRLLRPILAGRNARKVEALARELNCESRVFDLTEPKLDGVDAVLHCAGPFVHTSAPMVQACLDAGVHYLDITGEIAVFESIFARDAEAKARGVTLLPGVGFDVVPTDCLAAMLSARMPEATHLELAFYARGGSPSRGTMKTMIEGGAAGGAIRRDGAIVRVPALFDVRDIPFSCGPRTAMTIPWGDVSTAFRTTGIPNIRVYSAASPRAIARLRRARHLAPLLGLRPVKRALQALAGRRAGPGEARRAQSRTYLWGRVSNGRDELSMTLTTGDVYTFTAQSAVSAAARILEEPPRPGAVTPAARFGSEFVFTIEGVER